MDKITDTPKINYLGLCGLLMHDIKLDVHTKRKLLNTWLVLKCQHHQK